jgi:putative heme-binding domain-containing protein
MLPVLACLSLLAQHEEKDKKAKNPAFKDPAAIAAGAKLFTGSCAGCHGPRGEGGRGPNLRTRGSWHSLDEDELFQTIQKGIPGADMPATKLPDEQIWQLAAFVRALGAPAIESKPPGDAHAGETLFWGQAGCGGCHRVLGRGGMLGPDLSNIGALRPVDQLREAILDPDADGFRGYRGITVVTKSGKTLEGVTRDRTNYSVSILDKTGNIHLLPVSELRSIQLSKHSPMPGDYKQRLSREQIDNLIAYLSRLSVRPPDASTEKEKKSQ